MARTTSSATLRGSSDAGERPGRRDGTGAAASAATRPAAGTLPAGIQPMLAVAGELPEGGEWRYELKWDGVRALAYAAEGVVRFVSRSGRDLSDAYHDLAAGDPLRGATALLDGEVVAFDPDGRPSFQTLQSRLREGRAGRPTAPLGYMVFDVLQLGGDPLLERTYGERRRLLSGIEMDHEGWCVPGAFPPPGAGVLEASRLRGLEGVVAKLERSTYEPGRRSRAWVKVKNFRTQEVVVGGWTEGEGRRRSSFGSLLLGIPAAGGAALDYVGNVGTGFDEAGIIELLARLRRLERLSPPFTSSLPALRARRARFAEPRLVGEVRFSEWTDDGRLRQASWRGLRQDKSPAEVVREP